MGLEAEIGTTNLENVPASLVTDGAGASDISGSDGSSSATCSGLDEGVSGSVQRWRTTITAVARPTVAMAMVTLSMLSMGAGSSHHTVDLVATKCSLSTIGSSVHCFFRFDGFNQIRPAGGSLIPSRLSDKRCFHWYQCSW